MEYMSPEILMTILVAALVVIGLGCAYFVLHAHHTKFSKKPMVSNDVCTEENSSCYETDACNTCTMNNSTDDK